MPGPILLDHLLGCSRLRIGVMTPSVQLSPALLKARPHEQTAMNARGQAEQPGQR
jgi:hypothetical protein